LARGGFDIVLTDLSMPNLSGIKLIDRLEAMPGPVLIVVSAGDEVLLASVDQIMQRSTAHFMGILEKPVHRDALSALFTSHPPARALAKAA